MNSAVSNAVLKMIGQSNRPVRLADIIGFVENELAGKGSKICSLITVTKPKVRKTGNPNPEVFKVTDAQYDINFDYTNRVENARERAGLEREFEGGSCYFNVLTDSKGRKMPLAKHKEKDTMYFYAARKKGGVSRYFNSEGQELDYMADIKPFMGDKSGSKTQGLDDEDQIKPNTIGLDNVKAIKYGGECVVLTNE